MRILIATGIYPPDVGGPATYSKYLADGIPNRGHEIKILSFSWYKKYPKVIRHVIFFFKVLALGFNSDVVYAQDPVSSGFPAILAAKVIRKKFALKVVGDYAWEQGIQRFGVKELLDDFLNKKYGNRVEFLKSIRKFTANNADTIIVPSEYLKKIVEKWGIESDKIHVVYNTIQPINLNRVISNKPVLLSMGREVPWKGFKMLRELEKEMPEFQFKIGEVSREERDIWLAKCSIFLLNTGYEGFSHQLLEAMALGIPVITTDAGGNQEIVENEKNALVVGYNDKEAWLKAIKKLDSDKELQKKLSENAKITANKFIQRDMIEETINVLEKI